MFKCPILVKLHIDLILRYLYFFHLRSLLICCCIDENACQIKAFGSSIPGVLFGPPPVVAYILNVLKIESVSNRWSYWFTVQLVESVAYVYIIKYTLDFDCNFMYYYYYMVWDHWLSIFLFSDITKFITSMWVQLLKGMRDVLKK